MTDIWAVVRGHPLYEVSMSGQVRRRGSGRLLRPSQNRPGGYLRVKLDDKQCYVHRLVFETFRNVDCTDLDVIFLDGDRTNPAIENLTVVPKRQGKDERNWENW